MLHCVWFWLILWSSWRVLYYFVDRLSNCCSLCQLVFSIIEAANKSTKRCMFNFMTEYRSTYSYSHIFGIFDLPNKLWNKVELLQVYKVWKAWEIYLRTILKRTSLLAKLSMIFRCTHVTIRIAQFYNHC